MTNSISRVIRSKSDARKNYNRLSRWYDWLAGSSEEKYRQMGIELLHLKMEESVLEIGFGTGHCLLEFAGIGGDSSRVCGIDLSDGMVEEAKQLIRKTGVENQVDLILADGAHIPICEGVFDALFISFTLELFDTHEIPQVLDQSKRMLRSGGRLVLVTLAKTNNPALPERIYEWFHARLPVIVDCRPINAQTLLIQSGFIIEQVNSESMWGLPVEIIRAGKPDS